MSLTRAVHSARPRVRLHSSAILRCRPASTSSHSHEPEHNDAATDVYTKEGFSGSIWWKTVAFSLLGVAAYKYAPAPGEDAYLTRWIAMYMSPRDFWMRVNVKHAVLQSDSMRQTLLLNDARAPPVHRYRFPQMLDQSSPFIQAVGMSVDVSDVKVKGDKDN